MRFQCTFIDFSLFVSISFFHFVAFQYVRMCASEILYDHSRCNDYGVLTPATPLQARHHLVEQHGQNLIARTKLSVLQQASYLSSHSSAPQFSSKYFLCLFYFIRKKGKSVLLMLYMFAYFPIVLNITTGKRKQTIYLTPNCFIFDFYHLINFHNEPPS